MDSRFDEDNNLETQVMFGHLESTLAVRCLARNEMAAVSREIKLVSSGKSTHFLLSFFGLSQLSRRGLLSFPLGFLPSPDTRAVTVFGKVLPVLWQLSADGLGMVLFTANSVKLMIIKPFEPSKQLTP